MSTIKVNNILPFSGTIITANELNASGSFSGSFEGDGSGLTNLPASSPFPFTGDAVITGSLTISGSFIPHGKGVLSNTVIGENAGASLESGAENNIIIGKNAANGLTTGDNNITIGYHAGKRDTNTESNNLFMGSYAGEFADHSQTVAIGNYTSRYGNGSYNVYLGYGTATGHSGDTGNHSYNTLIGSNMATAITNAINNTSIGYAALNGLTTGDNNIAIGYFAGQNITTGGSNIIIGSGSLGSTALENQLRIGNNNSLVTISGSLTTGDVIFASTASAAYFSGDGSQLTGITIPGSVTGSLIATASISLNTITFTKGDGTTFPITVDTGSAGSNSGSFSGSFSGDGTNLTGITATLPSGVVSSSAQVNSGSFSGSFNGNGSNLTDVPVTVTNTLWVSPAGDDSTAIKGNLQRPWASVSASVAAATSGDSIIMEPGTYIEPPFTLSSGVTLKSFAGLNSTTISASNNSATFITQEVNSRLEGFTLVCPSGAFPGISYDNVGTGTIYDVTLKGQGNSIGFQIDETSATSKVIYNEIRYGGGDFDKLLYIKGGIFACDGIHIPVGGNIDKIYHVEAGRLQAINTNAGNPNISSSFYMEGGTSIILGTNLFNVQEAFHIAGQPYDIQAMNVYVDGNVPKHLTIDTGISGSDSNVVFVAAHMEALKISAPPEFVSSEHSFTFQDDGIKLKPAFRVYSDIEVGHANKGFTLGAGEGLPYNKGMEVWASGSGGVSQSLTVAATSKDSSTFDFAYSASGDYMYIGNKQKSPNIADQFLYFTGLEYKQVSTGSYSPGDVTLEIFTTASTWENIDGAQAVSSEEGYNYANNIFSHNDAEEEIIANVNTNVWATSSNFGIDARWGRIRLVNPITTSPVFEQFIYTPNTTLINPKGQLSFRGKALFRQTILATGNIWGEDGKIGNGNFTVGTGTGDEASWPQALQNSFIDTTGRAVTFQITIPKGTCTAYPLKVRVFGLQASAESLSGNTNQTTRINYIAQDVQGVLVNDPAGGKTPIARTAANTSTITSTAGTFEDITIDTVTDKPWSLETEGLDISGFYEEDIVFIRIEAETDPFVILGAEVSVVKWALGDRSQ
jgi:hypothetical protein